MYTEAEVIQVICLQCLLQIYIVMQLSSHPMLLLPSQVLVLLQYSPIPNSQWPAATYHTHHPTRVHAQRLPICDTSGGDHLLYPQHNLNDDIPAPSWYKCCGWDYCMSNLWNKVSLHILSLFLCIGHIQEAGWVLPISQQVWLCSHCSWHCLCHLHTCCCPAFTSDDFLTVILLYSKEVILCCQRNYGHIAHNFSQILG